MKSKKHIKNNIYKYNLFCKFFLIIIFILKIITIQKSNNNLNNLLNNKQLFKKEISINDDICHIIKNKLKKRTEPFEYEKELLFFFSLISCKIPFSFIRFADGEEFIMRGQKIDQKLDNWYWTPKYKKFRDLLIESSSICINPNNFIGIPCKNWIKISKSILSFSNCSTAKYMSYSTLFTNKNFLNFTDWIIDFIKKTNRWKIILVANSDVNMNISWAYKFFPIPDHIVEIWEEYSIHLLSKLSQEAKNNGLIFFVSAGPAANIIISYLLKINQKNIYIDLGSSIELITKGYTTRHYENKNSQYGQKSCESFILKDRKLIYKR